MEDAGRAEHRLDFFMEAADPAERALLAPVWRGEDVGLARAVARRRAEGDRAARRGRQVAQPARRLPLTTKLVAKLAKRSPQHEDGVAGALGRSDDVLNALGAPGQVHEVHGSPSTPSN